MNLNRLKQKSKYQTKYIKALNEEVDGIHGDVKDITSNITEIKEDITDIKEHIGVPEKVGEILNG